MCAAATRPERIHANAAELAALATQLRLKIDRCPRQGTSFPSPYHAPPPCVDAPRDLIPRRTLAPRTTLQDRFQLGLAVARELAKSPGPESASPGPVKSVENANGPPPFRVTAHAVELVLGLDDAVLDSVNGGLGTCRHVELAEDPADVILDRLLAQEQLLGDLLVR